MRSRLVKESLPGLPRANGNLKSKPIPYLHRLGFSSAVRTFFVVLFVSLGLSLVIFSGLHRFWYPQPPTAANSVLSRFASKPPLVDRAILDKILSLDLEEEINSESSTRLSIPINIRAPRILSPFQRPPRVTHIPELQPQALPSGLEMETQNRSRSERNADQVPSSRKFLLPVKIEERGANAHVQLVQLLVLARALNRTLVLPNVGKNGVGACRRWRFGVYYDERALSNEYNGDPNAFVRQDKFKAWVDSLSSPPLSRAVFLDVTHPKNVPPVAFGERVDGNLSVYIHDSPATTATLYSRTRCLKRKLPRLDLLSSFPPLSFVVDDPHRYGENNDNMFRMLQEKLSEPALARVPPEPVMKSSDHLTGYDSNHAYSFPDVLAIYWNTPTSIFRPHPTPIVYYSPQLRALAARLVKRLGPYIAVAWDVETSKADLVLGCVEALRSALRYVLSDHVRLGIRNIWLVGNLLPSELVHPSKPFCANSFTEELFFASDVKLTGVHQELAEMVREGEEIDDLGNNGDEVTQKQELLKDAGVLEILDKLVSVRSTIFVTASKSCGKTRCGLQSHMHEHGWD